MRPALGPDEFIMGYHARPRYPWIPIVVRTVQCDEIGDRPLKLSIGQHSPEVVARGVANYRFDGNSMKCSYARSLDTSTFLLQALERAAT